MTERVVEIRDGAVRFRVRSEGRGAPLVYFHSIHDRGGWPELLEQLAQRYTVHAPFHPGVAGSEGVDTLDDVVDLALAYDELLTALGIERAHLAGHFFGAMVAAEIAAIFPHRASRLALLSPLGLWLDQAPVADVLVLPAEDLNTVLWKDPASAAARAWAALPEGDAANVAAQIESIQRRASMARFVWPIPDKGLKKRLHRIAAPTLLLWGDADRVSPLVYADEWQRRIKGAEVRFIDGGHMLAYESPKAVASVVTEFLQ
jgi:pimeloyl-ACP methyl ester carboxylesterase